jgi:hypothetical protein
VIKNYLSIVFFFVVLCAKAQDATLLENFDKIPLSSKQSDVESFMSKFPNFSQSKITDAWAEIEYLGIEYKGPKDEDIILLFYNSVLYQKQLVVPYSIADQNIAKEVYLSLKKHITETNKISESTEDVISNQVYGSQIGENTSFYIDKSSKIYQKREAVFSAKLDAGYDDAAKKTTAKLAGYKVIYKATDLSKTALDAVEGFKSY